MDEVESSWSHRKGAHPVSLLGVAMGPPPKGCLTEAWAVGEEAQLEASGGGISAEPTEAPQERRASSRAAAVPGHRQQTTLPASEDYSLAP